MCLKKISILAAIIFFNVSVAAACDLCSIYTAVESTTTQPDTFRFGLAQQFTSYGKVQDGGKYVENVGHQHMESSITQMYGSYDLNQSTTFQLTLPYISRRFKRMEDGVTDHGTEAGIGDMSLLMKYVPYQYHEEDTTFVAQLFGGLKLPTGDSDRIGEELLEVHDHNEGSPTVKHAGQHEEDASDTTESTVHGHDLALGSGSYDFPVGLSIFTQEDRMFAAANVQYVFRTRGDFDYQYANDLIWDAGPGYYVSVGHENTIALKAALSGEYKRLDNLSGEKQDDTGTRSVFIGPEVIFTAGSWSGEVAWDIPLDVNNTGLQSVVDYKLRAALTYKF